MEDDGGLAENSGPPVLERSPESGPSGMPPTTLSERPIQGSQLLPDGERNEILRGRRGLSDPFTPEHAKPIVPAVTLSAEDFKPEVATARALANLRAAAGSGIPAELLAQAVEETARQPQRPIDARKELVDYAGPPAPERNLPVIERDLNTTVRRLGEFEEKTAEYRRSRRGRQELRELQRRLTNLLKEKLGRGGAGREIGRELDEAKAAVAEAIASGALNRADAEETVASQYVPESERHLQLERDWSSRTLGDINIELASVRSEVRRLEARAVTYRSADLDPALLSTLNETPDLRRLYPGMTGREMAADYSTISLSDLQLRFPRVSKAALDSLRKGEVLDELRRLYPNVDPNTLVEINDLERQRRAGERNRRSLEFLRGQRRLGLVDGAPPGEVEPRLDPVKRFLVAEKSYYDFQEEHKLLGERKMGDEIKFEPTEPFSAVRDRYERAVRGGDENQIKAAQQEVEAFLREAARRGYFEEYTEAINESLADFVERARMNRQNLVIDAGTEAALQADIDVWLAGAGTHVADYIARVTANGTRDPDMDVNSPYFAGVTEFWLQRLKGYTSGLARGQVVGAQLDGEYVVERGGRGHGWEISTAGYIELHKNELRTQEEVETSMLSYVKHLTGGVINVEPGTIISKADQFEQIFFEYVDRTFGGETAARLRRQFTLMVAAWGITEYSLLGRTEHAAQIAEYAFSKKDSVALISDSLMAVDGWVGISVRFLDRKKKYKPIHRYFGENGGLALGSGELGDAAGLQMGRAEYEVREKTALTLAEDIMIYDISTTAPTSAAEGADFLGRRDQEQRGRNLKEIVRYQTSTEFMKKFTVNERMVVIVKKVRGETLTAEEITKYGNQLSEEERALYKKRLERAQQAVDFARMIQSATGVRSQKAAPAYKAKVYATSTEGRLLHKTERDGVTGRRKVLESSMAIMDRREQAHVERVDYLDAEEGIRFAQFSENLARVMICAENTRRVARGQRPFTAWEMENLADYYRTQAEIQLRSRGYGARLLHQNGDEVLFLPASAARLAANDPGNVERMAVALSQQIYGANFEDPANMARARGQVLRNLENQAQAPLDGFQDGVRIDLDSATTRTDIAYGIADRMIASGDITPAMLGGRAIAAGVAPRITKAEFDHLPATVRFEISQRVNREIRDLGYRRLDFDEIVSHALSRNNGESYLSFQQEIRARVLSQEVRDGALRIRQGVSLPEEEDLLCSMLLQIDPTLRLRATENDKVNRDLVLAHVRKSKQARVVIKRELDKAFIDPETHDQDVYFGIPNEPFSMKELIWTNWLFVQQRRFGRRGYELFTDAPVHFQDLPSSMGLDLTAFSGVVDRRFAVEQSVDREITDSNVLMTWVGKLKKAHAVMARFAKGGTLGNEEVVSWALKPFDNLEAGLKQHVLTGTQDIGGIISLFEALRQNCGRLENTLKSIEAQDNMGGFAGAMDLSRHEIRYVQNPNAPEGVYLTAQVLKYNKSGRPPGRVATPRNSKEAGIKGYLNPDGTITIPRVIKKLFGRTETTTEDVAGAELWINAEDPDLESDTGLGVHNAEEFLNVAIGYATDMGKNQYKAHSHVIDLMTIKYNVYSGFDNFWAYFKSKAIRTGVGGQAA